MGAPTYNPLVFKLHMEVLLVQLKGGIKNEDMLATSSKPMVSLAEFAIYGGYCSISIKGNGIKVIGSCVAHLQIGKTKLIIIVVAILGAAFNLSNWHS